MLSFFFNLFFFFLLCLGVCRILNPEPEIELCLLAVEAQSPNHWAAGEALSLSLNVEN